MVGLVALPVLFAWVLFLPGYARSTRNAVFAYLLIPLGLTLLAVLLDGL